jgi:tetratricopeptide (TPR) repeat protein/DNA-binding CsgD family transcriptional regulator/predicted transcriptional regulator
MLQVVLPQDIYESHLKVINDVAFTRREVDMIACILSGRSTKKIASILSISPNTVENHIHNVMLKLGCRSQEYIIDYVEQSQQYDTFKAYYYWLKIHSLFEGILKKIRVQMPQEKEALIFYAGDLKHRLLQKMVKDLATSGIKVVVQNNERTSGSILLTIEGKKIMVAQQAYDYYFAVFEVIKRTFPELDISSYLTEFTGHIEGKGSESIVEDFKGANKEKFWSFKKLSMRWALLTSSLGVLTTASLFWILGFFPPASQVHQGTASQNRGSITPHTTPSLFPNWNLPFLPESYVPRVNATQDIWDHLLKPNDPATHHKQATTKIVGLTGPGGVGKTFLAMYCIHNPKQPYMFKAWFNAETPDILKTSYFELGEKLELFLPRMSEMQKIREVKSWIERQGSVLLVYDSTADVDDLYEFLPNNVHIIITSRNHKVPNAIEIGAMTREESLSLLENLVPAVIKKDAMFAEASDKLVNELNHFPLAIVQAAAYISEDVVPVSNYLEIYAKERKNLLSRKAISAGKQQEPIYVTWDMNLESISKMKEGEQALNLLSLISFCRPGSIPKRLLIQCLDGKTDEKAALEFNTLVGILRRYSLIKATTDSISIHRLVSDWLRDKFTPEERLKYLKKVMAGIQGIYPKKTANIEDNFSGMTLAQDYDLISLVNPHIETVILQLEPLIDDKEKIPLYALYADSHYSIGDNNKSKELLEKLVKLKEHQYGESHVETIKTLTNFSKVLSSLEEVNAAKVILKKVLVANEKIYGANHVENIPILQLLSKAYYAIGEGQKCLESIQKALSIGKNHYVNDHPKMGEIFYRHALAYYLLGDFQKSKDLFEKSLAVNKKAYGENHLEVGLDLNELGTVYYALGDITKGKEMIEKALAIFRVNLKPDHIRYAGSQINLGLMRYDLGDLETSKICFQEALKTRIDYYGPEDIWTGFALANLSLVYASLGNEKEGQGLLERVLVIIEKKYDNNPIWCSFLLNRIAITYYLLGEPEKSVKFLQKTLEKIAETYGKDHVFYAIIIANLGNVYRNQGDKEKSKQLLEEAYGILQKYWGPKHPTTLKAQANLALWESSLGQQRKKGDVLQYPF